MELTRDLMKIIIEAQFMPPVEVFAMFSKATSIYLEANENYQKRSFRNRCFLLNQGGKFVFSLPLEKGKNQKQPVKNVSIGPDQNWLKLLERHLQSAYGKSPFYSFYKDGLFEVLYQHKANLFDLNKSLISYFLNIFNWEKEIVETIDYLDTYPAEYCDLRNIFSPVKNKMGEGTPSHRYPQVFEYKHGFTGNLSIVDLIFNMGPESPEVLKNYSRKISDC
jgi:hypothetical protein